VGKVGPGVRRGAALLLVSGAWLVLALKLLPWGVSLAPMWLQKAMSLQAFRATTQLITIALGVGAAFAALPDPREALALRAPRARHVLGAVMAAPAAWVAASLVALWVALPLLLEELATRGAGASRANAGSFGRELTQAPALGALVWGALLAAIGEELLFRGAIWSFLDQLLRPARRPQGDAEGGEGSGEGDAVMSPGNSAGARLLSAFRGGFGASVGAALAFGLAHHDLPGGVGVVRVVSTACLGLASGVARQISGSIVVCIVLHALYNTLSLGQARGWLGRSSVSILDTPVASSAALAAALGLCGLGALWWTGRRRAASSQADS
jgi:membrane protease YdiL (CAAX protease family)